MTNTSRIEEMKRYLFDEMTEEESDALEWRFFEDNEYFEDLLELENDLIDSYAVGNLQGKDLIRFETSLANSPERREKVAEARALQKIIEEENPLKEPIAAAVPTFGERIAAFFNIRASAMKIAVGALVVLLVCAAGILLYRDWQKREEFADDEKRRGQINELEEEKERLRRLEEQKNQTENQPNKTNNNTLPNSNAENREKLEKQIEDTKKKIEQKEKNIVVPSTPKNEAVSPKNVTIVTVLRIGRGGAVYIEPTAKLKTVKNEQFIELTVPVNELQDYETIEVVETGKPNGRFFAPQPISQGVKAVIFKLPANVQNIDIRATPRTTRGGTESIGEFELAIPKNKK